MWHIGQKIVAVRDHSKGLFKKDQQFTIKSIYMKPCGCYGLNFDIGFRKSSNHDYWTCTICKHFYKYDNVIWVSEFSFIPLSTDSNIEINEAKKIIEETIFIKN